MATLTPIDKKNLPTDPATLKSLIDERVTEKAKQIKQRDNDTKAIQTLDDELVLLQGQAEYVFSIKETPPKDVKRDPVTGEKIK